MNFHHSPWFLCLKMVKFDFKSWLMHKKKLNSDGLQFYEAQPNKQEDTYTNKTERNTTQNKQRNTHNKRPTTINQQTNWNKTYKPLHDIVQQFVVVVDWVSVMCVSFLTNNFLFRFLSVSFATREPLSVVCVWACGGVSVRAWGCGSVVRRWRRGVCSSALACARVCTNTSVCKWAQRVRHTLWSSSCSRFQSLARSKSLRQTANSSSNRRRLSLNKNQLTAGSWCVWSERERVWVLRRKMVHVWVGMLGALWCPQSACVRR